LTTILAFLFVLGVLVFVHELGHFLAARRIGVRVLTFSLGFGPKLLKVQRGDTEYCISALPLGGYVKMAGETPDEPRTGAPDEFLSKTKWERFQVLIMGPLMNIVLAVALWAVVLAQGTPVPAYLDDAPVVAFVEAGSPAERVGIRPGDRFVTVAGQTIEDWDDLDKEIGTRPDRDVEVTVLRGTERITSKVRTNAAGRYEIGDIGVFPDISPIILRLSPGDPAEQAGLMVDDAIYAVNGERVVTALALSEAIGKHPNSEVDLTIVRAGQKMDMRVKTVLREGRGMIGVTPGEPTELLKLGPVAAVGESVRRSWEASGLIFRTLGGLFTGHTSMRQLQGPVGIAQLSGEAAQISLISLLSFMAMLSLNLGLLNLMPVPVLDGGHILIMGLEGIARRDFSMQAKEKMLLAGFVVLMMLMVTVIYNDLTRISSVERLMPWRN
jgi:regulator of sigma E protease